MARLSSELVVSLTDKVSSQLRGVNSSLDGLERKRHGHGGLTGRGAGRMTSADGMALGTPGAMMLAGGASLAAPLAAAYGGTQTVRAAADFESSLTEIQKKAGISAAETAKLGEEIKALATNGSLAVPIEEIAAAYERGAAAGIPIAELKEFAAQSVKAADAFGMSAEDVGNFAAKLKTSLGLSGDQVRRVFDLTNSLADAGIADESGLVDYMDRVGAGLKTLGMSPEQSLALGSTFLNLGMTSEVAATGTDALVQRLSTVSTLTGQKRKVFEKYMGSVGDFADMVDKNANGALLTMLDRLRDLDSRDRMHFLSEFMGADHGGKVLRLSEAIGEYRRNLALANDEAKWFGSLDASYGLKLDDFWSKWQLFKNEVQKSLIDLGTLGMPALTQGLGAARDIIREIDGGFDQMALDLDWRSIERAGTALNELRETAGSLMGMGGSDAPIADFFRDLTRLINETAAGIEAVKANISIARESAVGQVITGDDKQRQEGAERLGSSIDPETGRLKPVPFKPGGLIPGLTDFMAGHSGAGTLTGSQAERDRTDRVGRSPSRQVAERFGEPLTAGGPNAPTGLQGSIESLTAALRTWEPRKDLGYATGTIPVPTPRPDPAAKRAAPASLPAITAPPAPSTLTPTPRPEIERPVREEGERAAVAAEMVGQRIADAFNVTAAPQVDTSSIDQAAQAVAALRQQLRQLGSEAAATGRRVREESAAMAERASRPRADWRPNASFSDREP